MSLRVAWDFFYVLKIGGVLRLAPSRILRLARPETHVRPLQLFHLVVRIAAPASFEAFHGPIVYGWLTDRIRLDRGAPFPAGTRIRTVEGVRCRYDADDRYHVGLAVLHGSSPTIADWVAALSRGAVNEGAKHRNAPLGPGTRLERVIDGLTGETVLEFDADGQPVGLSQARAADKLMRAAWFDRVALERAAASLAGATTFRLRFDVPLKIYRTPRTHRLPFDGRHFELNKFLGYVRTSLETHGSMELVPTGDLPAQVVANRLVRVDATYESGAAGNHKRIPGAVGCVDFDVGGVGLPIEWARALIVAGFLGVGNSTNLGSGRFGVENAPPSPFFPPVPARTHAERASTDAAFDRALVALRGTSDMPGADGVEKDAFLDGFGAAVPRLRKRLSSGRVEAAPLRGVLLRRDDGKIRGLAVPTIEDRFLQRAVMESIGPSVDRLLHATSYAWRPGRSHHGAAARTATVLRDESRVVLEADVRSFFDRVDWDLLQARVDGHLGPDPIIDVIGRWVRAPVAWGGQRLTRTRGLPQGAPIAPMLANLYLDELDAALMPHDLELVRFGDDFVVLCRSQADAARARHIVEEALAHLRLELAPEKTAIATSSEGFRFLGHLFCQGLVIESPNEKVPTKLLDARSLSASDAAALARGAVDSSWAAEALSAIASGELSDEPSTSGWRAPFVVPSRSRRPVILVDPGVSASATERTLRVWRDGRLIDEIAWSRIGEICVVGGRYLHPSVLRRSLAQRIPIAFYTRSGRAEGFVLPDRARSPGPLARLQWAWHGDESERLRVATPLVEAKIHNLRLLARHQSGSTTELRRVLEQCADGAERAQNLGSLRGIEGRAAHAYFARWNEWLADRFDFPGRTGRGATDPINATLNLLYTQLFRLAWMSVTVAGLDAYLGVLHASDGRYAALAADMQEPFRFLCDRLVLELVHRERLGPEHFQRHEKQSPPCRLTYDGLRLVLGEWEKKLAAPVRFEDETRDYRSQIFAQAQRLADTIRGHETRFRPFRLKW